MTSFSSMPNSAAEVKIKSTVSKNPEQLPLILGSLLLLSLHTGIYSSCVEVNSFSSSFSFEFPESFKVVVSSNQVEEFQ